MKEDLKKYAKVGVVYHLLYPRCADNPRYHIDTLLEFLNTFDIETLDLILPFGGEYRRQVVPAIRDCGKEVVFCNHISLLKKINTSSNSYIQQELAKIIYEDQIKAARSIGAAGYVFSSGRNVRKEYRGKALKNFANFCKWFCKRLQKFGCTAMLEPFDTSVDKKFLMGPTNKCAKFIESLDIENLGIELDFAHIPLLGESFYEAIKNTYKYLKRVHLGNCIIKDLSSKYYGDKHPPIGVENGEIDTEELAEILSYLLEFGYLNKKNRGTLVLEVRPIGDITPQELVADNLGRLNKAWDIL